jgi:hypothetical protein
MTTGAGWKSETDDDLWQLSARREEGWFNPQPVAVDPEIEPVAGHRLEGASWYERARVPGMGGQSVTLKPRSGFETERTVTLAPQKRGIDDTPRDVTLVPQKWGSEDTSRRRTVTLVPRSGVEKESHLEDSSEDATYRSRQKRRRMNFATPSGEVQ